MTEEQVVTRGNPYELNRGFRRRMKKDLKLAFTPTRKQAGELVLAGFSKAEQRVEPVKKRIPRATFEKPLELPEVN